MAFKMTKPTFGKSPVEMQSPFKSDKQEDIANKQPVVSSESPGPNWVKEKGTNQWSYVEPPVVEEPVEDGKFLRERSEFIPPEKTTFPPEEERTTGYPAEPATPVSDVPLDNDESLLGIKYEDLSDEEKKEIMSRFSE